LIRSYKFFTTQEEEKQGEIKKARLDGPKVNANKRLIREKTFLLFTIITPPFIQNIKSKGGNIKDITGPSGWMRADLLRSWETS